MSEKQQSIFQQIIEAADQAAQPGKPDSESLPFSDLRDKARACTVCALRDGCNQVVFGEGNPAARLILVGEAPGKDEDRIGQPFVGRAGQLLDSILKAAEIKREDIYITNIVKCRPPGNRLPLNPEVESCLPLLREQIKLIDPQLVVCLGALATRTLIDKNAAITRFRGTWHERDGRLYMATFHPAALLRDPGKKIFVWEDFKQVIRLYRAPQS